MNDDSIDSMTNALPDMVLALRHPMGTMSGSPLDIFILVTASTTLGVGMLFCLFMWGLDGTPSANGRPTLLQRFSNAILPHLPNEMRAMLLPDLHEAMTPAMDIKAVSATRMVAGNGMLIEQIAPTTGWSLGATADELTLLLHEIELHLNFVPHLTGQTLTVTSRQMRRLTDFFALHFDQVHSPRAALAEFGVTLQVAR